MGLSVIGTLLLQRAGKILPHKTTAAFKMAQSSNSIFFQCLLLGSQSPALKTTDFTNRLFLKTRDISPRQSHRVGYPWHSTQMGSSHSKSNRGSWHWISWSLNTDWRNRILARRIWLQDETTTELGQPESWEQHPFLATDNCLHKGCWGSLWADQMSQASSLVSVILPVSCTGL